MRKTILLLLTILFIALPFHPFLSTLLGNTLLSESDILRSLFQAWKEIFIVLLIILTSISLWQKRKSLTCDTLDIGIIAFCILSGLTGIFFTGSGFPENIPQIIWGAKYGLFFLVFFFFVRHIAFTEKEKDFLLKGALTSGAIVIAFGIAQATFLPEEFLTHFGYSSEYGITETGEGISYCHKIENSITHEEFCRIQSFLSGPNQFAAYLLFLLPIFFFRALQSKTALPTLLYFLPFLAGGIALLLTWGRAAWIGAMAATAAFFVIQSKKPMKAVAYLGLFILGIVGLFYPALFIDYWDELKLSALLIAIAVLVGMIVMLVRGWKKEEFFHLGGIFFPLALSGLIAVRTFFDTFFWNIILRPSSSQGHFERWTDGARDMILYPFGLGLGDAGPASARFANPGETGYLPESWYLQVGLESGFLGLILFLSILFLLGKALLSSKDPDAKPLFLGLIGISCAAFFLHSWESATVALSFWGFCGIVLAPEKKQSFWEGVKGWMGK